MSESNFGPLSADQITEVKNSWRILAPKEAVVAKQFYARLFDLDRTLEKMFSGIDMEQQGKKFTDTITVAVRGLDHFDVLGPAIGQLGGRHAGYGVQNEHYDLVKRALLGALKDNLGDRFTTETEEAWIATYDALAKIMKEGPSNEPLTVP